MPVGDGVNYEFALVVGHEDPDEVVDVFETAVWQPGTVDDEDRYLELMEQELTSILEIKEVLGGTPAEHFGIQTGDIITKVDGQEVSVTPEVIEILWDKMPGDELEIEIFRNGQFLTITIVLDQAAPATPRDFSGR